MRVPPHATINHPAHLCHLRRRCRLIHVMTQCHILPSRQLMAASALSSSSLQLHFWHRPPVAQCHVHLVARSHIQPVAQCHLNLGTMPPPIRGAVPNSTWDIADLWRTVTLNLGRNAIFDLFLPTLALLLPAVKVLALLLLPLLLTALQFNLGTLPTCGALSRSTCGAMPSSILASPRWQSYCLQSRC
jgi:hypothetical protein